jgi:HEAT repeat protein
MGLVRKQNAAEAAPAALATPPLETLLLQLDDLSPDCRREAALALEGSAEAVPVLLERIGTERERTVRDAILTTLAAHDTAEVAEGLAVHLASDDAGLRTGVAEALATMPRSVPALLPEWLANPDHDVRVMAAMVLADLPDPEAAKWLARMISEDPHPNVVTAAIDALLPMATVEHAPALQNAVERFPDDPFLQFLLERLLPRLAETPR